MKPGLSLPIPQSLGSGTGLFLEDNGTLSFRTESQRPLPPSATAEHSPQIWGQRQQWGAVHCFWGPQHLSLCAQS